MLNLLFVGDFLDAYNTPNFIGEDLKEIIKSQDLSVVNFEAPVLKDSGTAPFVKAGAHLHQSASFHQLAECFGVALLANNHIMDYGQGGLEHTLSVLTAQEMKTLGAGSTPAEAYSPLRYEAQGVKIAFLNVAEAQFGCLTSEENAVGYAWFAHPSVRQHIQELKKEGYFVLVCCHAGLENEQLPLPEWRSRYKSMIDEGADLIIGHHPHYVQGREIYKGKHIYYSLGNFFFPIDQKDEKWKEGLAVQCQIAEDGTYQTQEIFTKVGG